MFNEALKEMKRTGEYDEIVGRYIKDGSATEKRKPMNQQSLV